MVRPTSTNNKTIGNTGGGITQINGTTDINSTNIGNTNIGNAGGGVTTINGSSFFTQNPALSQVTFPGGGSLGGCQFTNYSATATALNTEKTYAVSGEIPPGRYMSIGTIKTFNTSGINSFCFATIRAARVQQTNDGVSPPFTVGGVQQYIGGQGNELYEQLDYSPANVGIARQIVGFIDIDTTYKFPYFAINLSQPGADVYFSLSLFRMS
jgi:hypothetical protein